MYAGIDISVNHYGWVVLNENGSVADSGYLCAERGMMDESYQTRFEHNASVAIADAIKKFKGRENREQLQAVRLCILADTLEQLTDLWVSWGVTMVAVEQYAYAASGNTAYQIGEVGGLLRATMLRHGLHLRFVSPMAVQKWAVKGGAMKQQVVAAAQGQDGVIILVRERSLEMAAAAVGLLVLAVLRVRFYTMTLASLILLTAMRILAMRTLEI